MTILIFVIFLKSEKKILKKNAKKQLWGINSDSQNSDELTQKIIKKIFEEKKT